MAWVGSLMMDKAVRQLNLRELLKKKSFFLFGPRSVGKTTLIQEQLPEAVVYDLLDNRVYSELLRRPSIIEERLQGDRPVVIDEVQKLPQLLDEVHRLIQRTGQRFVLTGSSARKLKRGGANLLAGRAWTARLFPFTSVETPAFDLERHLNRGGLPQVLFGDDPRRELSEYVANYLREEIQAEAVTRNIQAFAEFLDLIALTNGQEINYESLASDCQVSPSTIKSYLQILEDTLIGFTLPGYTKTKKRKAISRGKHYLFDVGVTNTLARRSSILPKSELFGAALEHFIILELRAYLSYANRSEQLCYWRSVSQFEVDIVVGDRLAIEVKSTELVSEKHLKGLLALREEGLVEKLLVVSLDPEPRRHQTGIEILPVAHFLKKLWSGSLI